MDRLIAVRSVKSSLLALAAVVCFLSAPPAVPRALAQPMPAGFTARVFKDADGEHKYALFVPANYTPDKKWPIILNLHGAAERGTDGLAPTTVGLGPSVKARAATFPFLVVFPQCEDTKGRILTGWSADSADGKRALAILDSIEKSYSVDPQHRIVTGWSMGGYGTWALGAADPKHWSALVPVSGGGDPATAPRLKDTPIWAFHGSADDIVRADETRKMIDAVRAAGGHPQYSEIAGAGHDVWKTVYDDERLYRWMLAPSNPTQTAGPATVVAGPRLLARPGSRPQTEPDEKAPFLPAVTIPNAMSVRLGNATLDAMAHSVPQLIPADALTGRINDIFDSTVASGRSFGVQFSQIGYNAQVERAYVRAYRKDRLNVQLALRNVTLTIGATYVQGSGRSAVAGPISVVIGFRRPVWLSFDVTPHVVQGRLRLELVGTRFEIPDDNWYVTQPYGVSVSGLGMTEDRVSSALVEGIYGQKYRIEREALAIIPSLLTRLEERLDLGEVNAVAGAFWPLPVYRPRLKVWPQEVEVDDRGISLVMGVVAAAIDPRKAPRTPRVEPPAGISLNAVPRESEMRLGVAPEVLEPLTRMLIENDVARIHVLDIPEKKFAAFVDRKALSAILPDLAQTPEKTEIWAELVLVSPIKIRDAANASTRLAAKPPSDAADSGPALLSRPSPDPRSSSDSRLAAATTNPSVSPSADGLGKKLAAATEDSKDSKVSKKASGPTGGSADESKPPRPFEFVVPKAVISIAIKTDPKATKWTPYAEFEFDLSQQATTSLVRRGFAGRFLEIDWTGEPAVKTTARFAPGYVPKIPEIHNELVRALFLDAWKGWTQSGPASQVAIADVDFGYSKLRVDAVQWAPPVLSVVFAEPGVKITNLSKIDLVYETKNLYSAWSQPITLAPGKSHEFKISYPLLYRRRVGDEFQMYTLPVGMASEFRAPAAGGPPNLFRAREPAAPSTGR